ncbi:MAG: type IV pilin protein, partial [Pseudoxanthomonas sp.]
MRGFTLIELMIVVAVVAILAAVSYPSFQDQIRKSRRAQAKADLVEYAAAAERFHTSNNSYVGFTLPFTVSPREAGATVRYNLT